MTAPPTISPSNDGGFTLIEMLMAMLIMTVGLLGLLQSLEVAYQHNARNRMREEGVLLAEEQMNQFRRLNFDCVTAGNQVTTGAQIDTGIVPNGRKGLFSLTRDVRPIGTSNSKKLTVVVKWCFKQVTTSHVLYSMKSR